MREVVLSCPCGTCRRLMALGQARPSLARGPAQDETQMADPLDRRAAADIERGDFGKRRPA